MRMLDWKYPDADARSYWDSFIPSRVKKEVMADAESRRISGDDADRIIEQVPLIALEAAARRTDFMRLKDALRDSDFLAMLPLFVGDAESVARFHTRCVPRWMQFVFMGVKGASVDVSRMHARRAMKTPLGGSSVDGLRLPKRAMHFRVQPESALASPDTAQRAPITDVLVVEEPTPRRRWRIAVESSSAADDSGPLVTSWELPVGATLEAALEMHAAQGATDEDWRGLLAWVAGMLLLPGTF
ncbi:hypothetical protein [Comamonas sp. JC664]|uniref:hypothetical protein n=1 Tax=Comamonas sp. JC664 TaxID=2801917 RepID=UPI001748AF41|nr:hypothetical protein [Comamonas sp. JC664]MBL0697102.1 hypothetical protein [Comamonas sp. JC664]GHG82517.1 hypothetical protein GCM10012319_36680 [Comamonas sp. KCTC 72670]